MAKASFRRKKSDAQRYDRFETNHCGLSPDDFGSFLHWQGTWQKSADNEPSRFTFSGVLGHRKDDRGSSIIRSNDYGQWVILDEAGEKGKHVACYQSGPSAEYARLQMAIGLLDSETWQCKFADGAISPVQFANGRYQSWRGGGIYRSYALNNDGESWQGAFEFDGGPFGIAIGKININKYRQRSLSISVTVNTKRGRIYLYPRRPLLHRERSICTVRNWPWYWHRKSGDDVR